VRAIVVVLAFLYALAFGIPTALYLAGHYGAVGIVRAGTAGPRAIGDLTAVSSVLPGSPAAQAGIVPGDHLVRAGAEHAPPFEQIMDRVPAGHPAAYTVVHDSRSRTVEMTPHPIRPAPALAALIVALLVRGAIIALIGALLVLLRPSIMTAAFYILCLEFNELAHPFSNLELVTAVPLFWKPLSLALTCVVNGGGPAVAAIFCMRFPSGEPLPSWRPIEKAMIVVGVVTVALYFSALYAGGTYSELGSRLYGIFSLVVWFCYAVAAAAFMVRFARASGEDRARLRWVAIGLGSFLASYALFWYAENDANAPRDFSLWAQFVNVLPLTVLYAIVRHRVIDVRVAGGRALAFAILSAVPVIGFSLIDWALSNQLQSTKLALVADICVAVGFGFWVNSAQRRIDGLIEAVFFRARKIAEERLRRVARRLAHASEQSALDETLVREPYEALRLVATALYLRDNGRYARVAQRAWPDGALPDVDANNSLALELITTGEPVELKTIAWDGSAAIAAVQPSLAVPICVRRDTIGFLLLGEKRDGERFDALEQAAVKELAEAAANAYDHLEAEAQRQIAADLRRALDEAMRENETLRAVLPREASGT
jgi:GAF domain